MADGMFLNYIAASLGVMFEIFILSYPGQMLADTVSFIPFKLRSVCFPDCIENKLLLISKILSMQLILFLYF